MDISGSKIAIPAPIAVPETDRRKLKETQVICLRSVELAMKWVVGASDQEHRGNS